MLRFHRYPIDRHVRILRFRFKGCRSNYILPPGNSTLCGKICTEGVRLANVVVGQLRVLKAYVRMFKVGRASSPICGVGTALCEVKVDRADRGEVGLQVRFSMYFPGPFEDSGEDYQMGTAGYVGFPTSLFVRLWGFGGCVNHTNVVVQNLDATRGEGFNPMSTDCLHCLFVVNQGRCFIGGSTLRDHLGKMYGGELTRGNFSVLAQGAFATTANEGGASVFRHLTFVVG